VQEVALVTREPRPPQPGYRKSAAALSKVFQMPHASGIPTSSQAIATRPHWPGRGSDDPPFSATRTSVG
jgi:hypothetical protein